MCKETAACCDYNSMFHASFYMSSSSALGEGKIRVWCVFCVCNLIVINEPKGGEYLIKHELNIKQGVAVVQFGVVLCRLWGGRGGHLHCKWREDM